MAMSSLLGVVDWVCYKWNMTLGTSNHSSRLLWSLLSKIGSCFQQLPRLVWVTKHLIITKKTSAACLGRTS